MRLAGEDQAAAIRLLGAYACADQSVKGDWIGYRRGPAERHPDGGDSVARLVCVDGWEWLAGDLQIFYRSCESRRHPGGPVALRDGLPNPSHPGALIVENPLRLRRVEQPGYPHS